MDDGMNLSQHLDAVAESLYPPSMMTLERALRTSPLPSIRQALEGYSNCKVASLAKNLISALEYDPSALTVLEKLALDRRVRDAILDRSPAILEMMLKVICSNEKSFEKYSLSLISMLSHPLPPSMLIPHSIKHFLTLLTNSLARKQSVNSLRSLYSLMTTHPDTITVLVHSNQRAIHSTLSKYLVNGEQPIKFLTIACLAKMAQHIPLDNSQDNAHSLFEGTKGTKVMKLAVPSVIYALSSQGEQSAEVIRLCVVAVDAIECGVVREWTDMTGSGQQLQKLRDRGEGKMGEETLYAYFEFVYVLGRKMSDADVGMPKLLHRVVKSWILGKGASTEEQLNIVSDAIQTTTSSDLYCYYLETLEKIFERPSHFQKLSPFLVALTNLANSVSEFKELLSSKFAENQFSATVHDFLTTFPMNDISTLKCTMQSSSCPRHTARIQLDAELSLCNFVLKISFIPSLSIEQPTLLLALQKLTHLSSLKVSLDCVTVDRDPSFPALLEEMATPFPHRDSHTWKEALANELLRDAHAKYDNIINSVGFVCRDLEQRCCSVEVPLRRAQDEIRTLAENIELVKREKLQIEESSAATAREMEDKRLEIESLSHELRCARAEIEGCQGELRNAATERERILAEFEEEKERYRQREEELTLTNQALDEEMKETLEKLKELKKQVVGVEKEREGLAREVTETRDKNTTLETSLQEITTLMDQIKRQKDREVSLAQDRNEELEAQISRLKKEISSIEDISRRALEQAIEDADFKVSSLREEYQQKISGLQTKWEISESNLVTSNEKKDQDRRRLTRQVQRLKQMNEDQRQEMLKMVEAHDRLQRAAAEMNTLRFSTTRSLLSNPDVDMLSQQFSQIPADLSGGQVQSPVVSSPVPHRSKRSRVGETPVSRRLQRIPLGALMNNGNNPPMEPELGKKEVEFASSVTQDEEVDRGHSSPLKATIAIGSEYGDLIPDEDGFSEFDI